MKKKPIISILCLILIVCMMMMTGCSLTEELFASEEMADLNEVYGTDEKHAMIVLDGEVLEEQARIWDGNCYLSEDFVRSNLDKRFYWDGNDDELLFTDALEVHKESVSDPAAAHVTKKKLYLSTDIIVKYAHVDIQVFEEPGRVFINTIGAEKQMEEVKSDTQVRVLGGYKSNILTNVAKGDQVQILQEFENWVQVITADGHVGYMKKEALNKKSLTSVVVEDLVGEPAYDALTRDYTISLAWQDMEGQYGNTLFDSLMANVKGVNVISPTWFALNDNKGNFKNLSSASYVQKAHAMGMEVWILADDFADNMSIGKVLGKNTSRRRLEKQLVAAAVEVNADGINIDFEYIGESCGKDFIQFLREMRILCHEKNLVLSVDNANPTYYKPHYDMREQGRIVDYVVLMGYDEHWNGSAAGSVSSLTYVRGGIEAALEMDIPAERIISGLPFYTRLWTEVPEKYADKNAEIRVDGDSKYDAYAVSSETMSMSEAQKFLNTNGLKAEWDDVTGQYYAELSGKTSTKRIWIEDSKSIDEKMKIGQENEVGGYAFWRLGMEDSSVWSVVKSYLK